LQARPNIVAPASCCSDINTALASSIVIITHLHSLSVQYLSFLIVLVFLLRNQLKLLSLTLLTENVPSLLSFQSILSSTSQPSVSISSSGIVKNSSPI
jgi:hypothetical protein